MTTVKYQTHPLDTADIPGGVVFAKLLCQKMYVRVYKCEGLTRFSPAPHHTEMLSFLIPSTNAVLRFTISQHLDICLSLLSISARFLPIRPVVNTTHRSTPHTLNNPKVQVQRLRLDAQYFRVFIE